MTDITEYCAYCHNFFAPTKKKQSGEYKHTGIFTISDHTISPLDFISENQYFRIIGSGSNDGVYCNTAESLAILTDETFEGEIWEMCVPRAFLAMCNDISAWRSINEAVNSDNMSPFTSESYGGYSYSKGGSSDGGSNAAWQSQFMKRLNAWKRIYV